jgi:hypothetical protein
MNLASIIGVRSTTQSSLFSDDIDIGKEVDRVRRKSSALSCNDNERIRVVNRNIASRFGISDPG